MFPHIRCLHTVRLHTYISVKRLQITIHIYIYIYIYIYVCVCVCVCIYIYMCVWSASNLFLRVNVQRVILKTSWRQHPTKQQLYGHRSPITKAIKVRRTIHAGHGWRIKDDLVSDILHWTSSHGRTKQDGQLKLMFNSSVPIQDLDLKTSWER